MSSLTPEEQYKIQNPLDSRAGWDIAEYGDGKFETGFFGGKMPAWHGLGTVLDADVLTAADAIREAGLDWTVELVPTYATYGTVTGGVNDGAPAFHVIENKWGVQRSSDGSVLGIVSEKYKPVQNHEAFSFIDSLVDDGSAKYHTAGALHKGRVIWLLAKLGEDILINGMEDERIKPFLLLGNSHDGSKALSVSLTPIRVVCANTLNLAIGKCPRQWKARHRVGSLDKFNEAKQTLGLAHSYLKEFELQANEMVNTKVSKDEFTKLTEHLFPIKDDETPLAVTRKQNNRAAVTALFNNAANLENVRGTAWAAINAVGEWSDWESTIRVTKTQTDTEGRFKKALETDLKDSAMSFLKDQVLVTA